jgi:putative ABC transport system permease protein
MGLLARARSLWRAVRGSSGLGAEMEEEFRFHVDRRAEDLVRSGVAPAEARRRARMEFGSMERWREEGREARGLRFIDALRGDVRYAVRSLRRAPGFTVSAVLTFGLGIGAATAIFSVVSGVLLQPLPYRDPSRLVVLWEGRATNPGQTNVVTVDHFEAWRASARSFVGLAALMPDPVTVTGLGDAEQVQAVQVTPGYFGLLGVAPLYGRGFSRAEEAGGGAPVVILSHDFWQRHYGARRDVIGRTVVLDGKPTTIVGVMPATFRPPRFGWIAEQDIWLPFGATATNRSWGHVLHVVARVRRGIPLRAAGAELAAITAQLARNDPADEGLTATVVPLAQVITGDVRRPLLVLLGGVLLMLAMAAANVTGLTLALARRHGPELLVRRALGARVSRVMRQLVVQSTVTGVVGCVCGVAAAWLGLHALVASLPPSMPRSDEIALDGRVLLPALAVGLLATLVSGAIVAWRATRQEIPEVLAVASGRTTVRAGKGALVTVEMALATVLAILAVLTATSFIKLRHVDLGFDARNVVGGRFSLAGPRYDSDSARAAFLDELTERLRGSQGVISAALVNRRPFHGGAPTTRVTDPAHPYPPDIEPPIVDIRFADSAYFATLHLPILKGHVFGSHAPVGPSAPVIVNQALLRALALTTSPIGRHVHVELNGGIDGEIVGVAGDAHLWSPRALPRPALYLPRGADRAYDIVVRGRGDDARMVDALRRALAAGDPSVALSQAGPVQHEVDLALAGDRFIAMLLGGFALVGILLAGVGVFGVFSSEVLRARREIAVRMALGAPAGSIMRQVLWRAVANAGTGIAVGLFAAMLCARALAAQLFGVSPASPPLYAAVAIALLATSLLATAAPAYRATRVSPLVAMRQE